MADNLIELAKDYCLHFHEGQFRKGSNEPYSVHPLAVADILHRYGYRDETTQCVALLHDVVEDTGVLPREIRDRFGFEIAYGVAVLSKNTLRDGTVELFRSVMPVENISDDQLYKLRLLFATKHVQRVKIADNIDNTRTLPALKADGIERKLHDAQEFYIPLGKKVAPLMVKELEDNIENYLKSSSKYSEAH